MTPESIEAGKWYAVRIGQWIEAARVDGYDPVTGKWIAYLHAMEHWRPLPASSFVRESRSPERVAAMDRQWRMESMLRAQDEAQRQMEAAPALVDRDAGRGGQGCEGCEDRGHRARYQAIVCRQGSHFFAGDYGISRE